MDKFIKVATDFSPDVSLRSAKISDFSGEAFRDSILFPAFQNKEHEKIIVDFDGVYSCGSSFLEEAFGGLIRVCDIDYDEIINKLKLISTEDESYIEEIHTYLQAAHLVKNMSHAKQAAIA